MRGKPKKTLLVCDPKGWAKIQPLPHVTEEKKRIGPVTVGPKSKIKVAKLATKCTFFFWIFEIFFFWNHQHGNMKIEKI